MEFRLHNQQGKQVLLCFKMSRTALNEYEIAISTNYLLDFININ